MFRNRNKLSALALSILLAAMSLGTALAAENGKENDKVARDPQKTSDVPCAESNKQMDNIKDKMDTDENRILTGEDWAIIQLRKPFG